METDNDTLIFDNIMEENNDTSLFPPTDDTMVTRIPLHIGMSFSLVDDVLISNKVFDLIEMIINIYIIIPISVIGSAGNIISIIILFINGLNKSTNIVLVSMAVADLLIVLTIPLRRISLIIEYFDKPLSITVNSYVLYYNLLTLNRIWSLISNSHVAIISVERLLAVYFPFHVGRWLTVRRMIALAVSTHVIWYIALIPMFTMFDLMWIYEPSLKKSIALPHITSFYQQRESSFNAYNSYFINISVGAFLLLLTLICCSAIAIKIVKMGRKRKLLVKHTMSKPNMELDEHTRCKTSENYQSTSEELNLGDQNSDQESHPKKTHIVAAETSSSSHDSRYRIISRIDIKALRMLMAVCLTFLVLIFPTFFLAFFQGLYPKLRDPYWQRVNFVATSVSMLLITINSSINLAIYVLFSNKFHQTFLGLFTCQIK